MGSNRGRRIVVAAASAGGVEALQALLSRLPADFPAPVLVVLHVPATGGRALPRIMDRAGQLSAVAATDGEHLQPGRVYVAPPDRHLLVIGNTVRLSHGPRQNGHRPAADPLFGSAALAAGPRVIGVVLSGTLDDGAAGSAAVERRGGTVVIQDPHESAYGGMPHAAIAMTRRPVVLTVRQIAEFLDTQTRILVAAAKQAPDPELERYVRLLLHPRPAIPAGAVITCPECGGPLRGEHEGTAAVRYWCALGHSWSPETFAEGHSAAVERALWSATLRLDERWRLSQELAESAELRGHDESAAMFRKAADQARAAADAVRGLQAPAPAADVNADGTDAADAAGPLDAADAVGAAGADAAANAAGAEDDVRGTGDGGRG